MTFDISRFTFDPWKNFSGVVMEQGRVQLDSDWNEQGRELSRRSQAGALDIMGHAAYPATTPAAFQITPSAGPAILILIGCGRMYVDGLLAENHGLKANAQWDPALAELSGAPQPPTQPPPAPSSANTINFVDQPHLPGATLPTGAGPYLFYLDLWTRPVTFLEDPGLIDKAVAVDTTGRLQTVWQVKWMAFPSGTTYTCQTPDSQVAYPPASTGRLSTGVVPLPSAGPCCLTTGSGYTGVENQCYRVEIHQGGAGSDTASASGATFKWSRENGSVSTGVTAITSGTNSANKPASVLTVMTLGRDQVLGFLPGNWIEVRDDWSELWGVPGTMAQIDGVNVSAKTITLTTTIPTGAATAGYPPPLPDFPVDGNGLTDPRRHTRIIRWDQSGTVSKLSGGQLQPWCNLAATGGLIPVPASDTTLVLEAGVTVTFSGGAFTVGNFWSFDARTADGSVEILAAAPPFGIHHHYAKLAIVTLGSSPGATDCRNPWSCGEQHACGCCVCTVGEGGQYSSINQALAALPATGGEVCILPGRYFERVLVNGLSNVVIRGCGAQTRLASPAFSEGAQATAAQFAVESGLAAVVTVTGSQHVALRSLAIEAADGDAGVLLDQPPTQSAPASTYNGDIALEGLVITASTLPAIAAVNVSLLEVADNRIAMKDVASQWASIYASGASMSIVRNWIGLQDALNASEFISNIVITELPSGSGGFSTTVEGGPLANGGIHVAGFSADVLISDNDIQGGRRNGVTLGSFIILNSAGADTGAVTGLLPDGGSSATLQLPAAGAFGNKQGKLAAGSGLVGVQVSGNRITGMGLCGVGPIGFFDLGSTLEVITIGSLTVNGNVITNTLRSTLAVFEGTGAPNFGYGAVCLPDVQGGTVRDNTISGFGDAPGAPVCGVFVLAGEQIDISRNQIVDEGDWFYSGASSSDPSSLPHAGVLVMWAAPPAQVYLPGLVAEATTYAPGVPALRIEGNLVRVPLGMALAVAGFGPFTILGNHLASGGAIEATATGSPALTALIINLGLAIELQTQSYSFNTTYNNPGKSQSSSVQTAISSSGAVLFADNVCQLEARQSGVIGYTSVLILTLDHLTFSDNHCWLDGAGQPRFTPHDRYTAVTDALLLAGSLQACGNRFQEAPNSVIISGLTYGVLNVTTQNIATYCLFALGTNVAKANNLVIDSAACSDQYTTGG